MPLLIVKSIFPFGIARSGTSFSNMPTIFSAKLSKLSWPGYIIYDIADESRNLYPLFYWHSSPSVSTIPIIVLICSAAEICQLQTRICGNTIPRKLHAVEKAAQTHPLSGLISRSIHGRRKGTQIKLGAIIATSRLSSTPGVDVRPL